MADFAATIAPKEQAPAKTVRTAVVGVGGYVGGELVRLLSAHPRLQTTRPLLLKRSSEHDASGPIPLSILHPQLALRKHQPPPELVAFDWQLIEEREIELVFLALPAEISRQWAPGWLRHGVRVVDLSGAWRLHESANREVYALDDDDHAEAAALQTEAVYGSPELHRAEIAEARLVANPGCYATSIILALAPLVRGGFIDLDHGIVCDAKSGVSGAGKNPSAKTHFMYAADNLSAYSVFGHRHTGELLEQLGLADTQIRFTPHLLPIPRGILSTIYVRLDKPRQAHEIAQCFDGFYATSPMVRVRETPHLPQIQQVVRTNFCDLGFELAADGRRLVLVSCLDNLLKGAAGQAVQNMNLMCGWDETEGLI